MLEITTDNCCKCDLETIDDPNNSQYFWINRRDFEIETKRKDLSTQKYRKELSPNITFQPNKIFVRNDLFEKIIKSCKATNLEFLKLKEKLGLCIYEEICDEKEFILMSDIENEKLNKENENEKLDMRNEKVETRNGKVEMTNVDKQFKNNTIIKEEPKEIKSPNWFDKNKFKGILAIINSKEFTHRNKIGELKYDNIKDLVDNIKDNTVSEIDPKKDLNALNEIKNVEKIKYKKRTPGQKKLINLFNDLFNIISTDKAESESQENKNKKVKSRNEENEKVESRKEENENEYEDYENEYEYENEDDDETIDQNETIINLNDSLDEKIYKSKSFEEQIKLLKKKDLKGY